MAVPAEKLKSGDGKAWRPGTVVGVGLSLLVFAVLIGILFLLTELKSPEPPAEGKTAEQKLAELQAQDRKTLSDYGWIDRPKGIVRIPIDRAMSLLIEESNAAEKPKLAPIPERTKKP